MDYQTIEAAIQAADDLNADKGYAMAYAVVNERGIATVVRAHNIERWLSFNSARFLL